MKAPIHLVATVAITSSLLLTGCGGSSDEGTETSGSGQPSASGNPGASGASGSAAPVGAASGGPVLGDPLYVAGELVPEAEIKRFLCFGVGQKQTSYQKFQIILEEEIARRVEAGADPAQFEVSREENDASLDKQREDFLVKYPTLPFETEVRRAFLDLDLYRPQNKQALLFDKLFLPPDPADWPPLTIEVLREFGGDAVRARTPSTATRARKQQHDRPGPGRGPARTTRSSSQTWKRASCCASPGTTSRSIEIDHPDKLDDGVLMSVDGVDGQDRRPSWSIIAPTTCRTDTQIVSAAPSLLGDADDHARAGPRGVQGRAASASEEWEADLRARGALTFKATMLEMHAMLGGVQLMGTPSLVDLRDASCRCHPVAARSRSLADLEVMRRCPPTAHFVQQHQR